MLHINFSKKIEVKDRIPFFKIIIHNEKAPDKALMSKEFTPIYVQQQNFNFRMMINTKSLMSRELAVKFMVLNVQLNHKKFFGGDKVVEQFKVHMSEFNQKSTISKILNYESTDIEVSFSVTQAFNKKETIVEPVKKFVFKMFFTSFDSWVKS